MIDQFIYRPDLQRIGLVLPERQARASRTMWCSPTAPPPRELDDAGAMIFVFASELSIMVTAEWRPVRWFTRQVEEIGRRIVEEESARSGAATRRPMLMTT